MLIAPSPTPCDCPDCSSSPFPGFGTGGDLIQWLIGCGDSLLLKMEETSGSGMSRLPLISRLMKPYGNLYRAIAISGALAVGIAAYGSHGAWEYDAINFGIYCDRMAFLLRKFELNLTKLVT